jgi:hypothetical protein
MDHVFSSFQIFEKSKWLFEGWKIENQIDLGSSYDITTNIDNVLSH